MIDGSGARNPPRRASRRRPGEPSLPHGEELGLLPVVTLVGRPNTGKSTLFNRLTHSRRALVASTPGVTRDRNIGVAVYGGRRFLAVDTGGFESDEREELSKAVQGQALLAAEEADAVIVVVDGRAGLNPLDVMLVERLRGLPKPMFIAINKVDTVKQADVESDFYALGIAPVYPVSAEHGVNVGSLMDAVLACVPAGKAVRAAGEPTTAVAIIGRPNVGKSSLLNRLVGFERSIVTPTPGTTRDAIDTPITCGERSYVLVDTAGVRRRPKVHAHIERASVVRALRAVERAEVGLLLIDAVEGMTEQDARIAGYAWERGRALLLVVNKWDAVPVDRRDQQAMAERIDERYPSFAVIPKLFVSAVTGCGIDRLWQAVDDVAANHRRCLSTAKLNQVLGQAVRRQAAPLVKGKRPSFLYTTQTATAPPTIVIFTSAPERVAAAYERYLVNQIRAAFALDGTPLRVRFRARTRRGDGRHTRRR